MIRTICLLVLAISVSRGLQCQDGRLGSCHCQDLSNRASFELFCPSFRPQKQKLHIVVEPEKFIQLTCNQGISWIDIVTYIKNLQLGNIETLKMINCPVPPDPFASMLQTMGVSNTSEVKELNFNLVPRGSIQQLEGYHFADLPNLAVLELPRANIKRVDKKFFENLHGLKSLDLTDNRGLVIDSDSFHELKELQNFQCHSCYIASLPGDLFKGLEKLRRISLIDNKITELPLSIFNGLTSLEQLKLTRNRLSSLPLGIFDSAANLIDVNLGYNVLESLPNDLFTKNTKMIRFMMIGNGACQPFRGCTPEKEKRLKLSPTTFQSNSIEEIRINHSPIKEIHETLFKGCGKLVNLTIQHSLIDQLPENLFRDTKAIQLIDFSGNDLSKLEPRLFQSAKNVKKLRFIANNLTRLDGNLLSTLKKLETFHFHENHLFDLPRQLFGSNKRLSEIDLSHNNIHTWPTNPHVFESMIKLNLAHNKLTKIPVYFRINFLSLEVLNMSHNLLGSKNPKINPGDLNFLQGNLHVDLTFNQIGLVQLWDDRLWPGSTFPGVTLDLRGNPLKCNCWTTELKQKVEGILNNGFKNLFQLVSNDLRCGTQSNPPFLAGRLLTDVSQDELVCPFPSNSLNFTCTDKCRCTLNRHRHESMIDCSHLEMTSFPTSLPIINDTKLNINTNKIFLNMTGNKISNLSKAVESFTKHPTNIIELSLLVKQHVRLCKHSAARLKPTFNKMIHSNTAELNQLYSTFNRVWGAGENAVLNLKTEDGKVTATLELQLGHPEDPRPGAKPEAEPVAAYQQHARRQRGPGRRARDSARRDAWKARRQETLSFSIERNNTYL